MNWHLLVSSEASIFLQLGAGLNGLPNEAYESVSLLIASLKILMTLNLILLVKRNSGETRSPLMQLL